MTKILAAILGLVLVCSGCATIARSSVSSDELEANNVSTEPSLSSNGRYVAFTSSAWTLLPTDTNNRDDVFVRDHLNGTTSRVSISSGGAQGNGDSAHPAISADGRYVAFESVASNLVPGDTNGVADVFVHDREQHTTVRVSLATGGSQANDNSFKPSPPVFLSLNGGYVVAFQSNATNLVSGDTNTRSDIFVHSSGAFAGSTVRVSLTEDGFQSNGHSRDVSLARAPGIAGPAVFGVAYESNATNLTGGDANGTSTDVYVAYSNSPIAWQAFARIGGSGGATSDPMITMAPNPDRIVFEALTNDLVPFDNNGVSDAFLWQAGSIQMLSAIGAVAGNGPSTGVSISSDGSRAAFVSSGSSFVAGDTNNSADVFVKDLDDGLTRRVSERHDAIDVITQSNGTSTVAEISGDGRYVAFGTAASNLVDDDTAGFADIITRFSTVPRSTSVAPSSATRGATVDVMIAGNGFLAAPNPTVSFGEDVTVNAVTRLSATSLRVNVTVAASATTGSRHIVVANPGTGPGNGQGAADICEACFTVTGS